MVCVHYEIKKNGKTVLKNFGYYESVESAKKDLKSWERKGCEVIINK